MQSQGGGPFVQTLQCCAPELARQEGTRVSLSTAFCHTDQEGVYSLAAHTRAVPFRNKRLTWLIQVVLAVSEMQQMQHDPRTASPDQMPGPQFALSESNPSHTLSRAFDSVVLSLLSLLLSLLLLLLRLLLLFILLLLVLRVVFCLLLCFQLHQ